jgi:hypothetical protein
VSVFAFAVPLLIFTTQGEEPFGEGGGGQLLDIVAVALGTALPDQEAGSNQLLAALGPSKNPDTACAEAGVPCNTAIAEKATPAKSIFRLRRSTVPAINLKNMNSAPSVHERTFAALTIPNTLHNRESGVQISARLQPDSVD